MINKSFSSNKIKKRSLWPGLNNINPWIIFAVSVFCVVLIQGTQSQQPFDDAYITFRYARNISKGLGFVYNPGQNVLGTTTPLYTLLLAVIARFTHSDALPNASFIISIVADVFNVWLVFRLSEWIFKDRRIAIITSTVFLLQPVRLNVATGGMETSIYITCLLLAYDRYLLGARSLSTSIWAALAILIRPDAAIGLIPLFIDWIVHDQRGFLKGITVTGLIISPWIIWSTLNFGSPIPHSIIAKNIAYKNPVGHAAFYLLTFLGTGTTGPYRSPYLLLLGLLLGLPFLLFGTWNLVKKRPKGLVVALYPLIYVVLLSLLNPSMYFSWYFLPLMPGLLILLMASIWYAPVKSKNTRLAITSALMLFLIIFPTYLLTQYPNWPLSRAKEAAYNEVCNNISDEDFMDTLVLAPDIGVIGWCLEEASILDPIGLVSPESISYARDLPPEQLVSQKLISDMRPDYVISLDQYINPYIPENKTFLWTYQLIYEMDVRIVQTVQPLYVFRR